MKSISISRCRTLSNYLLAAYIGLVIQIFVVESVRYRRSCYAFFFSCLRSQLVYQHSRKFHEALTAKAVCIVC